MYGSSSTPQDEATPNSRTNERVENALASPPRGTYEATRVGMSMPGPVQGYRCPSLTKSDHQLAISGATAAVSGPPNKTCKDCFPFVPQQPR